MVDLWVVFIIDLSSETREISMGFNRWPSMYRQRSSCDRPRSNSNAQEGAFRLEMLLVILGVARWKNTTRIKGNPGGR